MRLFVCQEGIKRLDNNTEAPPRWRILLAFAAIYLIWGSTYLGIKLAIETIPTFLMAGSRLVISGGGLYLWLRMRGSERPKFVHWRSALVIGALMLGGGNGGVTWSEQYIPSGVVALMVAAVSFWLVLFDWLRPGGRRPNLQTIIGLIVGFSGVALLIGPGKIAGGEGVDLFGAVVMLFATFCWAIGSLYSRSAELPTRPILLGAAMEMLTGGIVLMLIGTLSGEWGSFSFTAISTRSLTAFIYLVFFGSLIGFSTYIFLLRHTIPARVATYAYVNPIVAVILGWLFGNESLTPRILLAAIVIVLSVFIITAARDKQKLTTAEGVAD